MADKTSFEIIDNSEKAKEELQASVLRALEMCGLQGEKYAKQLAPVDTGNLRNSITHTVVQNENAAYIGTNVEYAVYQELGTGKYVSGGRPTPWAYKDAKGKWHRTHGNKPQPFIRPAVADHVSDYKKIIESEMKS